MGTSNFYNKNASSIFAVSFSHEDEDGEFHDYSEFEYDDLKSNLLYELEKFNADKSNIEFLADYGTDRDDNRTFPSKVLGTLRVCKLYSNGVEVMIRLVPLIRSGYYEGVNLDWCIQFDICCDSFIDDDLDIEYISQTLEYDGYSKKMADYKSGLILSWVEKTKDDMVEKLENIYKMYSDAYRVAARFSNGETMYEKVS